MTDWTNAGAYALTGTTAPGRRLTAGDLQEFDEEFGHWFRIDAEPARGVVRLTLREADADPAPTFEQVRMPADTIDDFLNRFRAFAWRCTLGAP